MSLQFSQDLLSKREKQQQFKKSLDDQRRMKQEASSERNHIFGGNEGNHVPGLGAPLPSGVTVPGQSAISGLDSAPRFEGSPIPQQEKQPYMSALSEMNGRPLHVRQQQFQKESQYRNMLKDQIEENKKRKEAEKAKLDEEKRQELEEVRRLQGIPAPRRQQHAQFQESPDHPLPSPGRFPPARHHYTVSEQQPRSGMAGSRSDGRPGGEIPVHGGSTSSGGNRPDYPRGVGSLGCVGERQGRPSAPDDRQEEPAAYHERPCPDPLQVGLPAYPNDLAANGRREVTSHLEARNDTLSLRVGGGNVRNAEGGRPGERVNKTTLPLTGESAARTLVFDRNGREEASAAKAVGGSSDSVPRADFDELSNLCRDLLLEQKRLRQKLEEREERENLATERSVQRDELARQNRQQEQEMRQQRRMPRRGGVGARKSGGTNSRIGDEKLLDPSLSGSATSRVQGNFVQKSTVRRDSKPKPKSAVAFGSTRSRMPSHPVEKPRVTSGSKSQIFRGNRDSRISKSEPIPRRGNFVDPQQLRNAASTNGRTDSNGGRVFADRDAPASEWRRDDEGVRDTGISRFAEMGEGADWASRAENHREARGARPSETRDGSSSIDGLLQIGIDHHAVPSGEARAEQRYDLDTRYGTGGGELDGESTFLAAHPTGSESQLRRRY
ncbi:unnamed protein product [Hapterophycus canaliculatus]